MTVCCPGWIWINSNPTRTTDSHPKRIISANCCIHMVVPPDDEPRYARNVFSMLDLNPFNPTRTTDSHLKRIISTNCCIHMVVPPDDGPRYARNVFSMLDWNQFQSNQNNRQSSKKNNKYQLLYTYGCTSWWWA